jgi:hypothetical protein
MGISICFYFPYFEDSGVPVLFYRMANQIAISNTNITIYIIDYEEGVMWRNVSDLKNIQKIKFEDNKSVSPPIESILVMQPVIPYYWPKELVLYPNQKLFFWNLHPQNLVPSFLPFPYLREMQINHFWIYHAASIFYPKLLKRLRTFLHTLIDHGGLFFMDKSNLDFTSKYLFTKIENRQFIPVPAEFTSKELPNLYNQELGNLIRFGWVGRLCDFKSYILVYAILKLNEIAIQFGDKKFEFHIVGDGPFESYIRGKTKKCDAISIIFHGAIAHQELDHFILNQIDIVMAMGTSALEGAKLGKPTFLLDPSLKEVKGDYVFRMLYDTKEFYLAHFMTKEDFVDGNNSFYELISKIISDYSYYSKKSHDYFFTNHHLEKVKDLFLEKVSNSTLIYSMLDPTVFKKGKLLDVYNKIRRQDS